MKTIRVEGDGWDKHGSLTVRPVNVPGIGECVQLEGHAFSIILTPEKAKEIAVTMLRMAR